MDFTFTAFANMRAFALRVVPFMITWLFVAEWPTANAAITYTTISHALRPTLTSPEHRLESDATRVERVTVRTEYKKVETDYRRLLDNTQHYRDGWSRLKIPYIAAQSEQYALVVPSDQGFDSESPRYLDNAGDTIAGTTYSMVAPTAGEGAKVALTESSNTSTTGGGDLAVMFNYDGATVVGGAVDARIASADGSEFRIVSMEVDTGNDLGTSSDLTVTGYRDGVPVASDSFNTGIFDSSGSVSYAKNGVPTGFGGTLTFNTAWQNIDEIRFTGSDIIVVVDDLDFEDAVLPSPIVTNHPPNRTICNGGNTTFSVTATNATSYQWQENSGAGFTDLAEGGIYSGTNTATLTITGAALAMNGYQYRCRAMGVEPEARSNSATLTVIAISLSGSQTDVTTGGGNDGTATVTPSGGIMPYTYLWSPEVGTAATATGLTAGTYTVTVTDNVNCSATYEFTVLEPPTLTNIGGPMNFTENGPAVRIVDAGTTLTDGEDITGMTLVLDAAPNGSDEMIAYSAALNSGSSLASLGLTGGYNSGARTFEVSGTASPTVYQGVLRAMVYHNASEAPETTARAVAVSITNTPGLTEHATATISITAVNDAPTATNLTQAKTATEGGSAVMLDDIVVTDPDAGEMITATLTLSVPAAGTLSTGTYGSATSTFNAAIGVWTVTGSVADVNAALAAVAFTPSANHDQHFSITTRIRDAAGTGPADGTISVTVTAVNDAPVLNPAVAVALDPIDEDAGGPVDGMASGTLVSALVGGISDPDTDALQGIAIVAADAANGSWWFSTDGGDSWNALGTPSGSAGRLLAADAAARIHFQPGANWNGTLASALTIRAWDRNQGFNGGQANIAVVGTGGTTPFSAATATVALTVNPVADAPTATNLTQTKSVTEGGSAVALDDIVVTDPDAGETVTATLTLSNAAVGSLSTGTFGSATSTYNAGTGVWTVSGSVADVNAALAAVAFTPSADNDQNFTVTTRIRDAANTGPADGTISVTVTPVNDAPIVTAPVTIAIDEDVPAALTGISFADVDAGSGNVTATLSVPSGSLSATTGAGVTVGGTASALTLTGTIADINAYIAASNVTFTTAPNATGDVTLTVEIDDNGNTGTGGSQQDSGTVTLLVTAVNDAPVITVLATIAVTEDVETALTGISFTDADAGSGNATATLAVPSGSLSATSGSGVTVGGTASALTLTGTMANINAYIAASNVTYTPAANATGNVVLTASINDNGNTGTGGSQQDSGTVTLQVTAVNDAPVMTAPATIAVTEDVEAALTGISFADVDAGSGNVTATLSVPSGSLSATTGAGVTVGGTASALTLTGTIADINAYIAASNVTFTTAPNATGDVTLTVEIDDNGNTGTGGSQQDSGTVTLLVTAVNDAPTATNLTQAKIAAEGGSAIALDDIVVTDPDGGEAITATLTMSDPAAGSLSTGTFGSATSTYNAGTGVWTVSGSVADVNAALAAVAFTPSADNDQNFTITTRIRDAADTGPADGTISVTVVDMTPPVVTAIEVSGTPAANAEAIQFTVYFDEVPANISTGDFTLTTTGSASADIASHSPVNANTVTVTIDAIAGTGTLRLNVDANSGITDTEGNGGGTNGYVAAFTGGEVHTVDREAPGIPTGLALDPVSDSGTAGDGITNDNTPTLNGTADANVTLTVTSDADGVLGTTTSNGSGEWSFTPTAPLTDGTHELTATATDAVGNTSGASAALEITVDTAPHPKPSSPALATASDTGESNSDGITNLADITLQGTVGSVEANARVHARSDLEGGLTNATANADGSWSLDVSGLVEGIHQLQITATDVAGNTSVYSDALTVTIDRTAPLVSGVAFDQASVTAANQTAVSLSLAGAETGTGAAFTITGSDGGTPVSVSGLAVGSATQQFTAIDVSGLNDGTLTVSLAVADVAGNESGVVTHTISKDARVPAVTSVAIADGDYAEGDGIDVTITLDEDVLVSGTNSTLALDIGGTTRQAVFMSENAGVLLYQYIVQAGDNTDAAGVVALASGISLNGDIIRDAGSNGAALAYTQVGNANARVDTEAPTEPTVVAPATAVIINADHYIISGTHPENSVVIKLYLYADNDGVPDDALVLDEYVVTGEAWSLNAPLVANTANNVVVIAEDAAGNRSAAVDVPTMTEDSVAPMAPSAPDLLPAGDSGMSDNDNLTNNTSVTLAGTAEPNSTVTLTSDPDGVVGTALADGLGNWSITNVTLSAGAHDLTATATDVAGNTGVSSALLTMTVDTQAPSLMAIADQHLQLGASSAPIVVTVGDETTAAAAVVLTADSSDPAVVSLEDIALVGSGTNRMMTITAMGSGITTITLNAEDEAGNIGATSFTVSVNSEPTISMNTAPTHINQGEFYDYTPIANDIDEDELVFDGVNLPGWLAIDSSTGRIFGTPGQDDVGTHPFESYVRVSDDGGVNWYWSESDFFFTVVNVNDAPTIGNIPETSVDQDAVYSFVPIAEDLDGDDLTFSIVNKPDWAAFDAATGELSGTPDNGDVGMTTGIVISVSDDTESASLAAFDLEVVNVNDAPTISMSTAPTHINQGESYDYTPVANDIDEDELVFDGVNLPGWLAIDPSTGRIFGTPGQDDVGTHPFESYVRVSDDGGVNWYWSESDFFFTVVNVNDAPTIGGTPAMSVDQGMAYSFIPASEDVDGDDLTFSIVNKPDWADFDAATGELSGTPGNGDVGITTGIVIAVTDGTESVSLAAFDLEVNSVIISGITLPDGSFVYDGTAKSLKIEGDLPDGTSVRYAGNSRTDAGTQEVTATVSGGNYEDLVLTATLRITPGMRTLAFPVLAENTYGDGEFDGGASASSGEEITYTSSDAAVTEITAAGLIRITGAGEATITATVPENGNYANRPEISQTLVVRKASQTIGFNAPAEVNRDAGTVQLDVTASSGLPVSLAIDDEQVATLSGNTLDILRVGTVRITATQAGDGNHEAAEPVTVTVRVVDPSSDFPVRVHPAVSPNGDGINEFLIIEGIRDYPENRVRVMNRNGTVVWEASGYDNDRVAFRGIGTGRQQLPAGTYFYVVEIGTGSGTEYRKGYFVLRY